MKQRIILLLFAAFQLAATTAKADEGMWLLHMLQRINEAEMQEMGLNLSAEDIYSIEPGLPARRRDHPQRWQLHRRDHF